MEEAIIMPDFRVDLLEEETTERWNGVEQITTLNETQEFGLAATETLSLPAADHLDKVRLINWLNERAKKEVVVTINGSSIKCSVLCADLDGAHLKQENGDTVLVPLREIENQIAGLDLPPRRAPNERLVRRT